MEAGNSSIVIRAFLYVVIAGALVILSAALSCSSDSGSGSDNLTCAAACVDAQNRATSTVTIDGPSSPSACEATLSQIDTTGYSDPVCGDEVIQVASDGRCDAGGAVFLFEFEITLAICTFEDPFGTPEEWAACVVQKFQENGWPPPNEGCIQCGLTSSAGFSNCVSGTEPLDSSKVANCAAEYARALGACEPSS